MDDEEIRELLDAGLSVAAIAKRLGATVHSVRRRLLDRGWETRGMAARRENALARARGSDRIARTCAVHGVVDAPLTRGAARCPRCAAERVAARRRRIKEILVAEAGGACVRCGYARCARALSFHHIDPATKEFGIAAGGHSRGLARARQEVVKCVLLCANCHAEVETASDEHRVL